MPDPDVRRAGGRPIIRLPLPPGHFIVFDHIKKNVYVATGIEPRHNDGKAPFGWRRKGRKR